MMVFPTLYIHLVTRRSSSRTSDRVRCFTMMLRTVFLLFLLVTAPFLHVHAGGPKPPGASLGLIQIEYFLHTGIEILLQNELRNAVSSVDSELLGGMIKEHDADGAAIIGVNDTGAHVDVLLRGQA